MNRTGHQTGFTLIEVMFSLLIFIVAVAGLVALQHASAKGSGRGKQLTTAVSAASFFQSQLKNEFAGWTQDADHPSSAFPVNRYPMLRKALANGLSGVGVDDWYALDADSFRIDGYMGHSDLDIISDATSHFCVNYLITPLEVPNAATFTESDIAVWKTRVRVSWTKAGQFDSSGNAWKNCVPDSVTDRLTTSFTDDAVELVAVVTREFAR
ncbi:MAG: prepilin-type N-terminal cleavage/methylation domain-containing protein [Myxococcota bacterium]|nr:prepilin-type N-terminal cleavage/methylation domain-containing protein [Myxococcota bacterium]